MANRGRNRPEWEQMEKWMGGRFPFMDDKLKKQMGSGNTDWVGDYVQDVLKRSFSERTGGVWAQEKEAGVSSSQENDLDYDYEVFETHNSVIARVTVPEDVLVRNVRVYAGSMQLKLEQDPTRKKMYIPLPAEVSASSFKASVKNRILEIRCAKLEEAEVFREVRVRYL
jgi:HSP20 family molecular chaperone IbpA